MEEKEMVFLAEFDPIQGGMLEEVLDGEGNAKVITAMVWKTTTGATFELKSVD